MASIDVIPYDPALREEWDACVRRARARHFLFERGYVEYHADRFVDASLVARHGDRVAAVLPASRHDDTIVSHGGLTFGGLVSDADLRVGGAVEALGAALRHYAAMGARRLVYRPAPHIYHCAPAEEDLHALAVHGARLVRRSVSAARAHHGNPSYSTERRRAVRRGQRESLTLGRSHDYDGYVELLATILRDRHATTPVHSADELERLATAFPDGVKLFVAEADGALVAGVVVYETPVVAHCQYIAASDEGRRLRAQDALFDHLIHDVYAEKRWFDFGTSMRPGDGSLDEGLVRNKEGFGARAVMYDEYEVDLT